MNVLGIDPSTKTGAVVLNQLGEVLYAEEWAPPANLCIEERADQQADQLLDVMAEFSPGLILMEDHIRHWVNPNIAIKLISVSAILRYMLWARGDDFFLCAPSQLKKFISGKGNIKKDEVRLEVFKKYGYEHKSDNVVDAYVIAQMARYKVLPAGNKEQQKILESVFSCN